MKKFALWAVAGLFLASCSQQTEKGDFVINAHIDNAPLGKIYLEELTLEEAKVVDTAVIKDASGKFTLKGMLPEQALYRIRFADNNRFILLGLDAGTMSIEGDYNHLEQVKIENSEASTEIQQLLNEASTKNLALTAEMKTLDSLYQAKTPDSVMKPRVAAFETRKNELEQFIMKAATDTKSPAVAAFALSMVSTPTLLQDQKVINEIKTRFPENTLITSFTNKLNEISQKNASPGTDAMAAEDENMTAVKIGQVAPDFTLPDLSGKATSLSSFKGKYVLVDFWASWCKPCRMENPNVVQAYNTYKNKNFTIVGVSLDRTKEAWAKAIQADGLTWSHVSDLKFWESAVVPLYGLNSIPSNMLLDPEGKIIAIGLRGPELQAKLQEVLK
ncbi:TlpA disulfide reductase family protein [Chitinophaga filiformis]|uniref:Peroxiredoxin n=1 Tax=Chitinophaga filiformis TaxID=104663 RepID=A0A1G7INQ4_CHIFI|nr:TlpA disulfide reductase family protein [Chitinophaga filiformis]SDF14174.1 Peroxiredoxin [Chitinophaga filiformis]